MPCCNDNDQINVIRVSLGGEETAIHQKATHQTGGTNCGEEFLQFAEQPWSLVAALKSPESRFQFVECAIVDARRQKAVSVEYGYGHETQIMLPPIRSAPQRRATGRRTPSSPLLSHPAFAAMV